MCPEEGRENWQSKTRLLLVLLDLSCHFRNKKLWSGVAQYFSARRAHLIDPGSKPGHHVMPASLRKLTHMEPLKFTWPRVMSNLLHAGPQLFFKRVYQHCRALKCLFDCRHCLRRVSSRKCKKKRAIASWSYRGATSVEVRSHSSYPGWQNMEAYGACIHM